jgi:Ca2+-binding RTX toxin-like protein
VDSGNDVITELAGGGIDTIVADGFFSLENYADIENLTMASGSSFAQNWGNALANTLTGNDGFSSLLGLDGNDTLIGNGDVDQLYGGNGNDTLRGGAGGDHLEGEAGSDTFDYDLPSDFDSRDTINGFTKGAGGDVLDLRDLFDSIGYSGTDPVGEGYLSFSYNINLGTTITFDADGSLGAGGAKDLVLLLFDELTAADTANYLV